MTTGTVNVVWPVLKRPDEQDVVKIYVNVSTGVGEYLTSVISCPLEHHVFADYAAGPVISDKQ